MSNNNEVGTPLKMEILLDFEIAFPTEKRLTVDQYLAFSNREVILNVAAYFLGFKNHGSKYDDNGKFLEMFFRSENNELANQIYYRIKAYENEGKRIKIINPYSSLKLFEYFFSKPEVTDTQSEAKVEVNLFKAYLVLNSELTEKQSVAFPSSQESDKELNIPMMMFCSQYPLLDKYYYDIKKVWMTQMIKSIYLFEFLESNIKSQPLLAAFLAYFNCRSWQEYLKNLLPLTEPAIKNETEAHTDIIVEKGEKFEESCAFIEKLIIHEIEASDNNDFLTIRSKPFYKIDDGVYRIIFSLFVVEKIFKGVYFLLRDVNKTLPISTRIKEIKSFYGDEFSEKLLCYKVMESIYPNKCIRFSGKELANMKIDAAPDYYIRKGKDILVIESKDFLIAADKKMSFDFNVYEQEFRRILDFENLSNGKSKPKAVIQLVNSIRRILKNQFSPDTGYNYKEVSIYPVLLTHDHQYNTPGFNELIDFWFQDELSELMKEGLFIHKIQPLSVVNIDSLIYNVVGLSKNISLHEILYLYQKNKKIVKQKKRNFKSQEEFEKYLEEDKNKLMATFIPFSMFIDTYFKNNNLHRLPPLMEIVTPALFNEE